MSARKNDPAVFHKLYGTRQPRAVYYKRDFLDYVLMIALSGLVVVLTYGFRHVMSIVGVALCAFVLAMFVVRHGIELRFPVILRRPQDVLSMFVYKLQNLSLPYLIALGLLLLENVLIAATPNLSHHVETMRNVALWLFYVHFLAITAFRTVILIDHLRKKEMVRDVLMQTAWKRVIDENTNITLEIVHAYCTGLLTHIILIAPWYLVIGYSKFSLIFLPVVCVIDVVIHLKWMKAINAWFYRDHWLGHNSEFEFVFLHGTHHDAIPSAMIAVAENGLLEGFLRLSMGTPVSFYNPVMSFLITTLEVKMDMEAHQYIPGVHPRLPMKVMEVSQHSTHHYGSIEPYSFGIKVDQPGATEEYQKLFSGLPDELRNSAKLDEELTGFKWDNPTHRRTMSLYDKYHVRRETVEAL
ncbi:MAG TPA: hypothetical protein VE422_11700 [Terriglobia bacterium]|nr:hypothetical protein [Terriglobia bacterium]